LEEIFGVDGRLCLAPVRLVRSDDCEARKAEVGHSPCRRSYIEGIARGDEDDFDAVAFAFSEQDAILGQIHGRRRLAGAIMHAPTAKSECNRRAE